MFFSIQIKVISRLHHLSNWLATKSEWLLSNISDIGKKRKEKKGRAELQSVILSCVHRASCSLSPNLPIFILVFLPPTQEQSVKWLINVHLEEPHGQKKPHVDKNAQSASTDNTAGRSMRVTKNRYKSHFKAFAPYLKLFTSLLYLNIFLIGKKSYTRVHDETRLYKKTTKKNSARLCCSLLNITGVDRLCPKKEMF